MSTAFAPLPAYSYPTSNSQPYDRITNPFPPYYGKFKSRMEEWSYPRKRNDRTDSAKFFAKKLNEAHTEYWDGKIDLESYTDAIINYLEPKGDSDVINGFLTVTATALEDGTFCSNQKLKFSTVLLKAFQAFVADTCPVQDNDEVAAAGDETEAHNPAPAPLNHAERQKGLTRANIEAAYGSTLKEGMTPTEKHFAMECFYDLVIRFAKRKVLGAMFDLPQGTVDDKAQDVAVAVWEKLHTFQGGVRNIYPWLHRICYTTGRDGIRDCNKHAETYVPLLVEIKDAPGEFKEHPDLYSGTVSIKRNGKTVYQEPRPVFHRKLPDFIQGIDLEICTYIRAGRTYAQIADIMSLTEPAVKLRVRKMRQAIQQTKTESRTE
jgi:DNA-directed RNA polymerase specialized sigma24 family protein